jgi:FixJ family two-component response regulator
VHASAFSDVAPDSETTPLVVAVVDDDAGMRHSLESLLESAGYTVRLFPSATSLLNELDLAAVDCLVTDIVMPLMDGLELARIVRQDRPELPVILITGGEMTIDRLAKIRDRREVLRKPLNSERLLSAVREAIGDPAPPPTGD